MIGEAFHIEIIADDDRRHPGTAVMAGDFDAIGGSVKHALGFADRVIDLAGGDVSPLPPESVAAAVDEMEKTLLVETHQIAGAEPGVALREHVPQDLLL